MRRETVGRALGVAVLVVLLVAMMGHYHGAVLDERRHLASPARIDADYEAYRGGPVFLWLVADRTTDEGIVTRSEADGRPFVVLTDARAEPGDLVQVFGTLEADSRIAAERVVVHDRGNRLRMFVLSGVGALLAAGAFLRRWTVDRRRLRFAPRERFASDDRGATATTDGPGETAPDSSKGPATDEEAP